MAKHGNRSVSSHCGSADVLEALGVNLDLTPEQVGACVRKVGIGFLFAPMLHGAMKHAIGPRRELGIRTIFNIAGPLANPASPPLHVVGAYSLDMARIMAETLAGMREIVRAVDPRIMILSASTMAHSLLNTTPYGAIRTYGGDTEPRNVVRQYVRRKTTL